MKRALHENLRFDKNIMPCHIGATVTSKINEKNRGSTRHLPCVFQAK